MNTQTVKPELNNPELTKSEITQLRRDFFKKCGMSYSDITMNDINRMIELINKNGASHTRMKMSVCRVLKKDIKLSAKGSMIHAYIKVKGPYFDKREAISFNESGFIGFAGWADKYNVLPFVEAFDVWLEGYCQLKPIEQNTASNSIEKSIELGELKGGEQDG